MGRSASFWIQTSLLSAMFLYFGVVPAISTLDPAIVPPDSALQTSEGTIPLESRGRAGPLLVLAHPDGTIEESSCRSHVGGTHACISPKYAGARAAVGWFWASIPFGEPHKYPARLTVAGLVVRDRDTTLEDIKNDRMRVWLLLVPFAFALYVVCVALLIRTERRRQA